LSFNPFPELLIAFREWDTFFFGTAKRNGGSKSRRERSEGNARGARRAGAKRRNDGAALACSASVDKLGRMPRIGANAAAIRYSCYDEEVEQEKESMRER
jgi:hypothetical protein